MSSSASSCVTHQISSSTPQWNRVRWTSTSDDRWSLAPCTGTWRNTTMRAPPRPSKLSETSRHLIILQRWNTVNRFNLLNLLPSFPSTVSFMPSSGTALCWSLRRRRSAISWRQESFSSALDSELEWEKTVRGSRTSLWRFSGGEDTWWEPCWYFMTV